MAVYENIKDLYTWLMEAASVVSSMMTPPVIYGLAVIMVSLIAWWGVATFVKACDDIVECFNEGIAEGLGKHSQVAQLGSPKPSSSEHPSSGAEDSMLTFEPESAPALKSRTSLNNR